MSENFYRAFEDRHRGSRESIQQRLRIYLDFLRPLALLDGAPRLVDLGCGRGEWLELMRSEDWQAQGVDIDEGMLADCRQLGLDVRQDDALRFLQALPDASQSAVTAFQVAEHLPFPVLQSVLHQALRVLRPGGLLILETPNPENLVVGASNFYTDPSHARPLPPLLLSFLAEFSGFGRVATLRLHEGLTPDRPVELIDVLAGVSPDYAIVAQKGGFDRLAEPDASAALGAAFARSRGFTLNDLAQRYDQQGAARLRDMHVIGEMARVSSIQLQHSHKELKAQLDAIERAHAVSAGLERGAVNEMFALNDQISALNIQVQAMRQSTSWRVTAPLRWAGALPRMLRQHGAAGTARSALRHGSLSFARGAVRALQNRPKARAAILRMAKVLGLEPYLQRLRTVPPPPVVAQDPGLMSASARRVHQHLKSAIASRAENKEEPVADRH